MKKSLLGIVIAAGALAVTGPAVAVAEAVTVGPGTMIRGDFIEYGCSVSTIGKLPDGSNAALTAGHCIGDSEDPKVKGHVGKKVYTTYENTESIGESIYSSNGTDGKIDVAVIKLNDDVKVQPQKAGWTNDVEVGEKVTKTGRVTKTTRGEVTKVTPEWITATNTVFYGDSGSPLFDSQGRIIGQLSKLDEDELPKVGSITLPWGPDAGSVYQRIGPVLDKAEEETGFKPAP